METDAVGDVLAAISLPCGRLLLKAAQIYLRPYGRRREEDDEDAERVE